MLINEIFYSFQGEGVYVGTPAIFLRLSKCNLNCSFCDTQFEQGEEYSIKDLITILKDMFEKHNCNLLVITGGEPLLQYEELKLLINQLDCDIQIETNGLIRKPLLNATYVISPKQDIEGVFKFYKSQPRTYFKFLIKNLTDLQMVNYLTQSNNYEQVVYLQPLYENAPALTNLILNTPLQYKYKISGQLHKYLNQR